MAYDTNPPEGPTNPPIPDPALPAPSGPNADLPPLNPLRARSTIAAILTILGLIGPMIGGGVGELLIALAGSPDDVNMAIEHGANVVNAFLALVGFIWTWLERRAPHRRLDFHAPIRASRVPRLDPSSGSIRARSYGHRG